MLLFDRLSAFFEFSRQLIVDLRMVVDGTFLDFHDVSPTPASYGA
jgi:hypothetical protein